MPSYLSNQPRDRLTFVLVASTNVYYGFKTKNLTNIAGIGADDIAALGHLTIGNLAEGSLKMLRAQAPKPGRAKKRIKANPSAAEQGGVSTFYGLGKESTTLAAGWDLLNGGRSVTLTNNARTVSAIATLSNGMYYVFPMNKTTFETYGSVLGLIAPTTITTSTEEAKLVRGSSRPRPGRAILELSNGGTINSFYSTASADSAKQANWKLVSKERLA